MGKDIWVYIEHYKNVVANVSLELLGEAVRLQKKMQNPGRIGAVIIGSKTAEVKKIIANYGAEVAYIAEDERLAYYNPQYYGKILEELVRKEKPHIFLLGATSLGSQLAPLVGAKLKTGVAAHCVQFKVDPKDNLVAVVPAFGGKVLGDILCPSASPQMATVKPGIFNKPEPVNSLLQEVKMDLAFLDNINPQLKLLKVCREEPQGVPLEEADIVVCGGWGIGSQENWALLEKIAQRIGGAIACTRPPIDEGWAPGEQIMIGTSGKSIRPKVYLGWGVSGATHHLCGMKDSDLIISINKDENAEIFKVSDYGLVGDIEELLPLLAEKLGIEV